MNTVPSKPDDPIAYVIGLPGSFRGDVLVEQLSTSGFHPSRVDGVVVRELAAPRDSYFADSDAQVLMRRSMTEGEIGCALAHQSVYRRLVDHGLPHAFVFEDDARLVAPIDVSEVGSLLDVRVPRIITFYAPPGYLIGLSGKGADGAPRDYVQAAVAPTTTTGYALNRAAALLLIEANSPVRSVADWPPAAASHIEFLFPVALPVEPLPDASSLDQDRAQATGGAPRGLAAVRRRVAAASHFTWLRHRRLYGDWSTYLQHELLRMTAYGIAGRRTDGAHSTSAGMPLPIRLALKASHSRSHRPQVTARRA